MSLNKLSANTVRKLGLCEDHFLVTSFTNATKTRLIRNAIPIPYENADSSTNTENVEMEHIEQIEPIKQENTVALSSNNENFILKEQMPQECDLRTYRPATLNFEMSAEEENVMEWVHFEPMTHENTTGKNTSNKEQITKRTNKKSNTDTVIKKLRLENLNLRQKIRRLKNQLQCVTQTYKELKEKNQTKKVPKKRKQKEN